MSATVQFLVISQQNRFFKAVSLRNLVVSENEAVARSAFQQIIEIITYKDSDFLALCST